MRAKKKSSRLLVFFILTFGCVVFFLLYTTIGRFASSIFTGFVFDRQIQLETVKKDNTLNLLLLGIGGGKHDGPNLTDTIIFAHLNPENNTATLISIPRDLWMPEMQAKINSSYAYGLEKNNKGILFASAVVGKVLGEKIDYTVVVDFEGFIKLVDLLGGVDVKVERTLDDYYYPIPGKEADPCDKKEEDIPALVATASSEFEVFPCRYQHIHFDQGTQSMTGEQALLFVRSRHAEGAEGSDFARSKRQHTVISAVRNKVLSLGTLLNPVKVIGMYDVVKNNISTDIEENEMDDFIKLAQKMQDAKITQYVLDEGDSQQERYGLLFNPMISEEYRNQWVLAPRAGNGNFNEIHQYVDCVLKYSDCEVTIDNVGRKVTPTPVEEDTE